MSPISSEFSRFPSLTHLNLSDSSFSGKVPIEVSFLSKLISLDLSNNYDLRLEEPGFELLVQNLTKVRELNLRDVNISSVVSNSLLNLTSLTLLDLSFCGLLGKLPDGIFHLSHLNELSILYNLALTGYFPEFINSSSPLQYLDLSFTNFSGELPDSIGNLKSLKKLAAYDCKFYGSIPTSLGNLTAMTHLEIGYNNFTGMLPSSLSNLGNLVRLQVAGNNFEGIISDILPNSKSLLYLHAGSNNFSSPFPSLVSNLTSLVELDLSHNQLRGPLPSQIIGFPNLTLLSLDDNLINGTIPSWVFSLPALNHLSIRNNKLTGHVKEFKSTDLNVVDLSNNNLHGMFPSSTFKLEYLYSLILSSNNFSEDQGDVQIGWFDLDGSIDNSGWLSDESNNEEGTEMKSEEIEARIDVLAKRADEKGKLPENTGMENSTQELGAVSTVDMEQETALKQFEQKRVEDNQKTVMAQHPAGGTCDVKVSPTEPDNYLLAAEGAW
ncbi:hypothetical protein TEA_018425 [Camellia sinensis var. sinensis]|uniref:Uncharacterized protein n=1 Tax=Camellia sinensis var. sinensis TaxID=542762 RepID=A0A4S4EUB5_CAMSN|nr:hypothetical protein TEA_018425 [Camellia sinensis var. sinensis]